MTSIARLRVLALATSVAAGLGPIVHTQSTTIVAVSGGSVRGVVQDGVASWKGIPFAAPPLGQPLARAAACQAVDGRQGRARVPARLHAAAVSE